MAKDVPPSGASSFKRELTAAVEEIEGSAAAVRVAARFGGIGSHCAQR